MSLVSVASASLASSTRAPRPEKDLPKARAAQPLPPAPEQRTQGEAEPEFVVTRGTVVLLNGKPCRYEDVPSHARIVRMEVAADKKTVLKVYFRTGK
jgi:hypothetical protein